MEIKDKFNMNEWELMHSFIQKNYRIDHALCSRELFEWLFCVHENNGYANIFCAWDSGQLIAIHGYVKMQVFWGDINLPQEAVWTAYWMTSKEAPAGTGWLLTRAIQKIQSLTLSVNASSFGLQILKSIGWKYIPIIPRYLLSLDIKQCKKLLPIGLREDILEEFKLKDNIRDISIPEIQINNLNYNPDWALYPLMKYGTVRSLDYLRWRYLQHPFFDYKIVFQGGFERPAVCIYRVEKAYGYYESLVAHIVDFYFPNDSTGEEDARDVLMSVVSTLKKQGCSFVDFYCSMPSFSRIFEELGANEEPEDKEILPTKLEPILHKNFNQNLIYFSKDNVHPNSTEMYITKSDIDGDSPVNLKINLN